MEGGDADLAVGKGSDIDAAGEGAIGDRLGGAQNGEFEVLEDAGEDDVLVLGGADEPVGVDADDHDAGVFLDGGGGAEADGAGDRQDDVRTFVDQILAELLALVLVVEVTGEEAVLLGIVPTEQLHGGAVLLVEVLDAFLEAHHEVGDGRDVDTAESADLTGLGHACGGIAGEEGAFLGGVYLLPGVLDRLAVGEVENLELLVGVRLGRSQSGIAEQEADGDDEVTLRLDELVDVLLVVSLLLRLQVGGFPAKLLGSLHGPTPGGLVERLVVHTTCVRYLADFALCLGSHGGFRGFGGLRRLGRLRRLRGFWGLGWLWRFGGCWRRGRRRGRCGGATARGQNEGADQRDRHDEKQTLVHG